ncbi:MAG: DUF4260 domain-containing protein [Anaerolineae bacterium]
MQVTTLPVTSAPRDTTAQAPVMARSLLHLEGLALLAGSIALYAHFQGSALWFAVLLFAPDVAMIGYMRNPRVGSWVYNLVHTTVGPLALAVLAFLSGQTTILLLALIWLAHIGVDRTMGYGLKYPTAFKDTHFQHL